MGQIAAAKNAPRNCDSARCFRIFGTGSREVPESRGPAALWVDMEADEERRLIALQGYGVVGSAPEKEFDDIAVLATRVCAAPVAVISFLGRETQWMKSAVGMTAQEVPRGRSVCNRTLGGSGVHVIADLLQDPALADHPLVTAEPHARFYAGAPLLTIEGLALGTLCVLDRQPRSLTPDQQLMLEALARQVMAQLELRKQNAVLAAKMHELSSIQILKDQLLEQSPVGICIYDEDWNCLSANEAMAAQLGATREQLLVQNYHRIDSVRRNGLHDLATAAWESGAPRSGVFQHRSTFGRQLWMVANFSVVHLQGRRWLLVMTQDVTELRDNLTLLDNLTERVPGAIYQFRRFQDGRTCFPFASDGIREIFGVAPEQVREDGRPALQYVHPQDLDPFVGSVRQSFATLEPWHCEFRVTLPGRGLRWMQGSSQPERLEDGSVLWHGYITDITARKAAHADLERLAHYDALTGLPNRVLLMQHMRKCVDEAVETGRFGVLLFVDLDHFKRINDARGHSVGDAVLSQVARRLSALMGQRGMVARVGGDEFVLLGTRVADDMASTSRAATAMAELVRRTLESPYYVERAAYRLSASVGVTIFPRAEEGTLDLLREADTAMYRAKETGRNGVAVFEPGMLSAVQERLALEQDLKTSLAAGQMVLHVQPQVDSWGRELGGELLLRWQHPQHGLVPPSKFIPIAEESGFVCDLGEWVIRHACEALVRMSAAGSRLHLSVNISPRQFHAPGFVASVRELLEQTGAPADRLVFEVTEGLFIGQWEEVAARMRELHGLGIRFSIDDFGTGYSNLSYLRRLPLYELKIDRSFVQDIPEDAGGMAIASSIIALAKHLQLCVVAEGVESRPQVEFLSISACDSFQGFFFAQPEPLEQWLAGHLLVQQRARPQADLALF